MDESLSIGSVGEEADDTTESEGDDGAFDGASEDDEFGEGESVGFGADQAMPDQEVSYTKKPRAFSTSKHTEATKAHEARDDASSSYEELLDEAEDSSDSGGHASLPRRRFSEPVALIPAAQELDGDSSDFGSLCDE